MKLVSIVWCSYHDESLVMGRTLALVDQRQNRYRPAGTFTYWGMVAVDPSPNAFHRPTRYPTFIRSCHKSVHHQFYLINHYHLKLITNNHKISQAIVFTNHSHKPLHHLERSTPWQNFAGAWTSATFRKHFSEGSVGDSMMIRGLSCSIKGLLILIITGNHHVFNAY